ncbi:HAD family phosphatase [Candidatus Micrarchaeota archaeon]|jgi:HAD superfamily hydrolase (TIGR01509 family)|nr:HAD family phosphatase [Candidatus Micrarchaeota archaeon]
MKAIIFDMDGVIVDSEPIWKIINFRVYKEFDIPMDDKLYSIIIGKTEDEVFKPFLEKKGHKGKELEDLNQKAIQRRRKLFIETAKDKLELFPKAKEKIIELNKKGYKLAIATSSFKQLMDLVVNKFHIRKYFEVLYSGEDVVNGKPNPEIYLKTMKKLGVKAHETVIIEDSIQGLKAAKDSGAYCIAVETTNPKDKLSSADKIIKDISYLPADFDY